MQSDGLKHLPECLDRETQQEIVDILRICIGDAPLYTPAMPRSGRPFSVRMTNLGVLGWVSDKNGYRYQEHHPTTGRPWPAIPERIMDIWHKVSGYQHPPEACLVNYYKGKARMGLHRDEDEADMNAPVVSISLGDSAVFRIGGTDRRDKTGSIKVHSGDIIVMGGPARLAYHGIDRTLAGTSTLLKDGGRINLTLRRVTVPS
ncbi:MAG: alpha-ketoglutarate-dependent dioxygenase AlkB [Rhizobiales bacterium]|nr:alpha-ketoglutarate-dependent dioxygenase AlkB [Hyphomicrobiales bacterium]